MNLEDISTTSSELKGFEEEIAEIFKSGVIKGPVHFSSGNEEQVIKIFRGLRKGDYIQESVSGCYSTEELIKHRLFIVSNSLRDNSKVFEGINQDDWICTSYRNHYHALLKGVPKDWLKNQIVEGNSMQPLNEEYKFFTSGIVGGQLPIALGIAKSLQMKKSNSHVWAFCGDMAAETGVFYETTKYADNHKLPITFIVEDNGLSVDTPTNIVWNGRDSRLRKNTIRYPYKSLTPHQGLGKEVGF